MRDIPEFRVRAVVFQSGEWWIAQCLEYDLVTLAHRLEDLPRELHRVLTLQVQVSLEHGIEPFEGYPKAPARFWKMYENAKTTEGKLPQGFQAGPVVEARLAA